MRAHRLPIGKRVTAFLLRDGKPVEPVQLPKLDHIRIEHVGNVLHPCVLPSMQDLFTCERIIAGERISDADRKAYKKEFEDKDDSIDFKTINGAVSGSLGFLDFRALYSDSKFVPSKIHLEILGVEPQYRRRGVGKRLLGEVEKIAVARGIKHVEGLVESWRADRVLPFYERLGYKVLGTRDSQYIVYYIIGKDISGT